MFCPWIGFSKEETKESRYCFWVRVMYSQIKPVLYQVRVFKLGITTRRCVQSVLIARRTVCVDSDVQSVVLIDSNLLKFFLEFGILALVRIGYCSLFYFTFKKIRIKNNHRQHIKTKSDKRQHKQHQQTDRKR